MTQQNNETPDLKVGDLFVSRFTPAGHEDLKEFPVWAVACVVDQQVITEEGGEPEQHLLWHLLAPKGLADDEMAHVGYISGGEHEDIQVVLEAPDPFDGVQILIGALTKIAKGMERALGLAPGDILESEAFSFVMVEGPHTSPQILPKLRTVYPPEVDLDKAAWFFHDGTGSNEMSAATFTQDLFGLTDVEIQLLGKIERDRVENIPPM